LRGGITSEQVAAYFWNEWQNSLEPALGTQDFEEVIRALQNAAIIVRVYKPRLSATKKRLLKDADKLKSDLIQPDKK
jgi:hypothetical protein